MKGKIYYNGETQEVIGYYPDRFKFNYTPSDFFIEIEEENWKNFNKNNYGKNFKVINNELTAEAIEENIEELRKKIISSAVNYLKLTDWLVIRKIETEKDYDQKYKNSRQKARENINSAEFFLTVEELKALDNNYYINKTDGDKNVN